MKKRQIVTAFWVILGLIFCVARQTRCDEVRPALTLQLKDNQTILVLTGSTGAVYAIQSASDLSASNPWKDRTLFQARATNQVWADLFSGSTNQQFYRAIYIQPPANTNLIFIQPGIFTMGSSSAEEDSLPNERPQTVVTITQGFWVEKYAVTQGEYQSVVGQNPSYFTPDYGYTQDLTRPVEQVSWEDATNYCLALTEQELAAGRIPYKLCLSPPYRSGIRIRLSRRYDHAVPLWR